MKDVKYRMSFTIGGLFYIESLKIAESYLELKDWTLVRKQALENNLLQARTLSSAKRVYSEISNFLRCLSDDLLELLLTCSRHEQLIILWVANCKAYAFIHEFATEVMREKFLSMDNLLTRNDYQSFYNTKADWHEELDNYTERTKSNNRSALFKKLRDAEIIDKNNQIIRIILTPQLLKALYKDDPRNMNVLPISDNDIKELLNNAG